MLPLLALSAAFLPLGTVYGQDHPPETLCSLHDFIVPIPASQNKVHAPQNAELKFLAMGFGTQNYTCSGSGVYQSIGAFAELIDISCVTEINDTAKSCKRDSPSNEDNAWRYEAAVRARLGSLSMRLGWYYSAPNEHNGTPAPKYDFSEDLYRYNPTAYTTCNAIATAPAPDDKQDVPWVLQGHKDGELADYVLSYDTKFGQPPSKCQPGSPPIEVRYSAKYAFYRSSTRTSTGSGKPLGVLNAALSSGDTDSSTLQKLLDYAPAILGLLGVTTALALILVIMTVLSACRGRRNSTPTRSAAYRPIQLPRAKAPADGSYHDEPEPYGS